MASLNIHALNGLQIELNGDRPRFRSVKERAMLVYLALERKSHSRLALAGLLWPDEEERRARRNLSQTLLNLRKALADDDHSWFDISTKDMSLKPSADVFIDVVAFKKALQHTQNHEQELLYNCEPCTLSLEQARQHY